MLFIAIICASLHMFKSWIYNKVYILHAWLLFLLITFLSGIKVAMKPYLI